MEVKTMLVNNAAKAKKRLLGNSDVSRSKLTAEFKKQLGTVPKASDNAKLMKSFESQLDLVFKSLTGKTFSDMCKKHS